jgi:acyl-CoA reductase-like NAD-dependent aldehyde dehydrogenase
MKLDDLHNNYIEGELTGPLADEYFEVKSPFYEHTYTLPNSGLMDLGDAIASARSATKKCRELPFSQRKEILNAASEALILPDEGIEHLVKMTGMPIRFVRHRIEVAKRFLKDTPGAIEYQLGQSLGGLGRKVEGAGYELLLEPRGVVSAFLPPNDPAESAFIFAHTVIAGGTIVLKPSQTEPYMAAYLAQLITKKGYPFGAINVIHWNSADTTREQLAKQLIKQTAYRIFMGDINSAKMLFETRDDSDKLIEELYSSGRNSFFWAGKSKAIVDEGFDENALREIAADIASSALDWTMDCVTTKTVIAVGKKTAKTLEGYLLDEFKRRESGMGDPLDEQTLIGYVHPNTLSSIVIQAENSKQFKQARSITGTFRSISGIQMAPMLVRVAKTDYDSPFINAELPYTLSIVTVDDFKEAAQFVNAAAAQTLEKKAMGVAVFTPEEDIERLYETDRQKYSLIKRLDAYMVFYNQATMNLSPLMRHQGILLSGMLSEAKTILTRKKR